MASLPKLFAVSLALLCCAPGIRVFATSQADPVLDLVGEWDVPGTTATIVIKANHFVMHHKLGRGDIKFDNAQYYTINYRERSLVCHYQVRVYSDADVEFARYENTDAPECDIGKVRRPPPPPPDPSLEAANAAVVTEPADPVAKAAFKALDKHCARCHQNGRLSGRKEPAPEFGNILKLEEIAGNTKLILPGNGYGSSLVNKIVSDRHWAEGAAQAPSKEDINAIVAWIEGLGNTAETNCRPAIGAKELVALIAKDLDSPDIPQPKKSSTRYLTLTNIYNACVAEKPLEIYRQAAIKLINSLTRLPNITKIAPIDPAKTILRINISDLGWSAGDWDKIVAAYPYATRPTDTVHNRTLEQVTGAKLAYVRADWFAFTASRPPLYNRLLDLSGTFRELEQRLNASLAGNITSLTAKRAGFQTSTVSLHNRLIERHSLTSGYLWRSYDFASNDGDRNLFEHPLGPGGAGGFQPDANETIFTLPNGFQGYFLNDGQGRALDKAPPDILHDANRVLDNRDPSVVTGISCMGCHGQGLKGAKDEIRARVLSAKEYFPRAVSEAVTALYPEQPELNELFASDNAAFKTAMAKAGVTAFADSSGAEIVYALSSQYERPLTLQTAAAEFGMSAEEFGRLAAARAEGPNRLLVNSLTQEKAPRDRFEKAFASLAAQVADEELIAPAQAAPVPVAKIEPAADLTLSLTADKAFYKKDDIATFTVVASQDCYLTFLNVDRKGAATVIFPNKWQQDNRIRASMPVLIPGPDAQFDFHLRDRGTETLIAICTEKNVTVDGIEHRFGASSLTEVPDYSGSVARSMRAITAEARVKPGAKQTLPEAMPSPGRSNSARVAIKVQVK
jgi:hypothetical protein